MTGLPIRGNVSSRKVIILTSSGEGYLDDVFTFTVQRAPLRRPLSQSSGPTITPRLRVRTYHRPSLSMTLPPVGPAAPWASTAHARALPPPRVPLSGATVHRYLTVHLSQAMQVSDGPRCIASYGFAGSGRWGGRAVRWSGWPWRDAPLGEEGRNDMRRASVQMNAGRNSALWKIDAE